MADSRIPELVEGAGNPVKMVWSLTVAGGDPVFGVPAAVTPESREIMALTHFVTATTQLRQFAEVQAGDCLMDISPEIQLDGLQDLRFVIDGREWSSKPISESLAKYWDVMQGGRKLLQTVLLQPAP